MELMITTVTVDATHEPVAVLVTVVEQWQIVAISFIP